MSTIIQSSADVLQVAPLHRFSTADYLDMIEKEVLGRKDKVELIGGIIVEMSPAGIPHNHFLMQIIRLFAPLLDDFEIAVQGTLTVAEGHVYDPDFMLLKSDPHRYKTRLPDASDIVLVVEAAQSSLRRDQQIKTPVYASAGIPEYWIADLAREELIVHRDPADGTYQKTEIQRGDDVVSPSAAPALSFSVRRMLD